MKNKNFKYLLTSIFQARKIASDSETIKLVKNSDGTPVRFKSVAELKESFKRTWKSDLIYYGFYIWWNWITDLKWKVPNLIERAYYGVGFADVWQFEYYVSKIIIRAMKQIKKSNGIPGEIYEVYRKSPQFTEKQKDKFAQRDWNKTCNTIIDGFESYKKLDSIHVMRNKKIYLQNKLKFHRGMELFGRYFNSLCD